MKLAITVLIAAISGAVACSHNQPPRIAQAAPATTPTPVTVEPARSAPAANAEPTQLVPGAASIPKDPSVAPPYAPASKSTEDRPVTSASFASPRAGSVPAVAPDPARDQPETSDDVESVRELRALLAADKSLSPTARQITIIARRGRVYLIGQVNTADERAAVERAARKAANVIDVTNRLVVLE
jgi:hypothetical protein